MLSDTNIAKLAMSEAEKLSGQRFPGDELEFAEHYVRQGFKAMQRRSGGYNPRILATPLAEDMIVEYTKARLLGQNPFSSTAFILAAKTWGETAAAEHHRRGDGLEDINQKTSEWLWRLER